MPVITKDLPISPQFFAHEKTFVGRGAHSNMRSRRLPERVMFGNLECAVRKGRGGKEKEWADCVQSDVRALFGIARASWSDEQ